MVMNESINPFETTINNDVPEVEQKVEQDVSFIDDAGQLLSAANKIRQQTKMAVKRRDYEWLGKLRGFAARLNSTLGDYIIRAIELAVFKFIVELCAMIMNHIMEALTKKGRPTLDISSGGVMYAGKGPAQTTQTSSNHYSQNNQNNPFGGASFQGTASPSAVAPW